MKRRFLLLLFVIAALQPINGRLQAQSQTTQQHLVQPGDTWTALSRRYGISQETIRV